MRKSLDVSSSYSAVSSSNILSWNLNFKSGAITCEITTFVRMRRFIFLPQLNQFLHTFPNFVNNNRNL